MPTVGRLIESFIIDLKGRHVAAKTVATYGRAARDMAAWH